MTRHALSTSLLAVLLVGASAATAGAQQIDQETNVELTRAVVATGVEDREPVGEATQFGPDVGRVYFYTVFEGDFGERHFEHVWLRDGEEVARVPLVARGPRWRTWSSKDIPAEWAGDWSVRVVDATGTELESVDFTVGSQGRR